MNYLELFKHKSRFVQRKINNLRIGIVCDVEWCGEDFSDKQWGIFIRDTEKAVTLFSNKRYRFEDRKSAIEFLKSLTKEEIKKILDELTSYNADINEELKIAVEKEVKVFDDILKANNISYQDFCGLYKQYHDLPCHIKRYYRIKYNMTVKK